MATILRARGYEARRGYQARGGEEQPDVETSLPGFRLEVKRTERFSVWAAYRQCQLDLDPADDGTVPLVLFRRNRSQWLACLALDDLLNVLGEGL